MNNLMTGCGKGNGMLADGIEKMKLTPHQQWLLDRWKAAQRKADRLRREADEATVNAAALTKLAERPATPGA